MADKKDEKKKKTYRTKHPVRHDKKHYDRGKTVEMTPEQAAPLVASGHLEEVPAGTPDAAPPAV